MKRSNEKGGTKRAEDLKQGRPALIEVFEPRILLSANPLLDNPLTRSPQEERDTLDNTVIVEIDNDAADDVLSTEFICLDQISEDEDVASSGIAIDDLIDGDLSDTSSVAELSIEDEAVEPERPNPGSQNNELIVRLADQVGPSVNDERADADVIVESVELDDGKTIEGVTSATEPAGVLEDQPDSENEGSIEIRGPPDAIASPGTIVAWPSKTFVPVPPAVTPVQPPVRPVLPPAPPPVIPVLPPVTPSPPTPIAPPSVPPPIIVPVPPSPIDVIDEEPVAASLVPEYVQIDVGGIIISELIVGRNQ